MKGSTFVDEPRSFIPEIHDNVGCGTEIMKMESDRIKKPDELLLCVMQGLGEPHTRISDRDRRER